MSLSAFRVPWHTTFLPASSRVLLLLTSILIACGDDDTEPEPLPGPCESELLVNTVSAAPAVQEHSDIASYAYEAPIDELALQVELRDAAGETLASMRVAQRMDGTMEAQLGEAQLLTHGRRLGPRDLAMELALQVGDSPVLHIEATLRDRPCQTSSGERELSCAPDLSLDPSDGLILPTCGLDYDERIAAGQLPTLTDLAYAVSDELETRGAGVFAAIHDGTLSDENERSEWLESAGVADMLASRDARLLIAAYADRSWSRLLAQHVAECIGSNAFEYERADGGVGSREDELISHSNGNRDTSSWGGSGNRRGGYSKGDPHMSTFDQRAYDFQGHGEFVLSRSTDEADFEVQARFEPREGRDHPLCRSVSYTTAVAARLGDRVIEVRPGTLLIDGAAVDGVMEMHSDSTSIEWSGSKARLRWADGTELVVGQGSRAVEVDLYPASTRTGRVEGLFGNFDANPDNDLVATEVLDTPASFEAIHRDLRRAWTVDAATSLFAYDQDDSHDDYDDPDFPAAAADSIMLPPTERDQLESECRQRGVGDATLLDCVLDLFCDTDPADADEVGSAKPALRDGSAVGLRGDVVQGGFGETYNPERDPLGCDGYRPDVAVLFPEPPISQSIEVSIDGSGGGPVADAPATLSLAAGARSYLLHMPEQSALSGSLRFEHPIVGLQWQSDSIESADLLPDGTANGAPEGLEPSGLVISDDLRSLHFERSGSDSAGSVRVITEVAP